MGWVPVTDGPEDEYHREAFDETLQDGTYELLGPKIQGNPEKCNTHILMLHIAAVRFRDVPRGLDTIRSWLEKKDIEGLVFRHSDGRMGKIKKKDFGLKRKRTG